MHIISSYFFTLLRKILFLWVRTDVIGNDASKLGLDPARPVVYVLQHKSLSSRLVLEQEILKAGMPSSQAALHLGSETLRRSHFFLYQKRGRTFRKRPSPTISDRLRRLIEASHTNELDVQVVPVTLYWGRAPEKEKSLFKLLLTDAWSVGGRLKQLFVILVHGKNVFLQFSKPVSLSHILEGSPDTARATRKTARLLRVHFRLMRQAVVGPDLSHRRTLVSRLIRMPEVELAIEREMRTAKIDREKATLRAKKYAEEIASNVSIGAVQFLDIVLSWVWNKIYNGVAVNNIEAVKDVAQKGSVIYVPCHRSHIDYLLLSYVLYNNGLMVPHIAAGINLNMPVLGSLLRRGGAFFMRRTFKSNQLYAAVFTEYMHSMFVKGFPVEYFVEGGRSRTGRTLAPKAGMVAMTVRSYLREPKKELIFVPVYVGYEKILEAGSYLGELRGKKKQQESLFSVFKSIKNLRNTFGQVSVNFGQPMYLSQILNEHRPDWREQPLQATDRPNWLKPVVDDVADRIVVGINAAAALNPVNILSTFLLATPRQSIDATILVRQSELLVGLLRACPYSAEMTCPDVDGPRWIDYLVEMGLVEIRPQKLGDIVQLDARNAILLTYYRNNILHLLALPGLIATFFQHENELKSERLHWMMSSIYPYIRSELFLRWSEDELPARVDAWLAALIDAGMLSSSGDVYHAPPPGSLQAVCLQSLARSILPTLERYYTVIAILRRHGSGRLTDLELEERSTAMAERMSILYGLNAPEFFDKTLFRNFIHTLRSQRVVSHNEEGFIVYNRKLDRIADEARFVLDSDLRQSIIEVAEDQVTHRSGSASGAGAAA
ncbi:glycerol-3-phosphate 1-O-acyltransferase PlsB [Allohahella sp. A8]|uniref:glycerol-3-phosphate 1-O-acyltransferase PlsB n=1 Tax=Allohahella sp. A8 TaxID=3141461 RepID=UPI003A80B907